MKSLLSAKRKRNTKAFQHLKWSRFKDLSSKATALNCSAFKAKNITVFNFVQLELLSLQEEKLQEELLRIQ